MMTEIAVERFHTLEFDEWHAHLASAIGHHKSSLLTPDIPFVSSIEAIHSENVSMVALEGRSSLRLHRHQAPGQAVLWLPQSGWIEEIVNGHPLVAEPGTAMLCLPGDELQGDTTPALKGVSLLMPASLLGDLSRWHGFSPRLLANTSESLSAIQTALEIVSAMRNPTDDLGLLVGALAEQLIFWRDCADESSPPLIPASVDRRLLISQARDWIVAHLDQSFQIAELAAALYVSPRTLQYCFVEELGHSPLAEVRRVRFHVLRHKLLTIPAPESIEVILRSCGLNDTPVTRRHYRNWCGETPRQTRARAERPPALI
jgi:AraC-like DNA-binding protein